MVLRISVILLIVANFLINYVSIEATKSIRESKEANKMIDLSGIIVSVLTSYRNESCNHLDPFVIDDYAKVLASKGVSGVLVGGPASEWPLLTLHERKIITSQWARATKRYGLKLMVTLSTASTMELIELAKYAERYEVDAIVVIPFAYYKPMTAQKAVLDLKLITDCLEDTPIIYYDTITSGVKLNLYEFFPLATKEITTFYGLICDMETAQELTSAITIKDYQYLIISKHISARATFALGYRSSVSAAYNICPEIVVAIEKTDDRQVAAELQARYNKIILAVGTPRIYIASFKAAFYSLYGIQLGNARAPIYGTTYEDRRKYTIQLQELGIPLKKPVV